MVPFKPALLPREPFWQRGKLICRSRDLRSVVAGVMRSGLTPPGLRHARGVELAMAGARDAEVMAQIEHATDKEAKIYRRQAERRSLTGNGRAKIDNVIDLRAKRRAQNQG